MVFLLADCPAASEVRMSGAPRPASSRLIAAYAAPAARTLAGFSEGAIFPDKERSDATADDAA